MKICVISLEGAAPEIVFGEERLINVRRLMDLGTYGHLQSMTPPDTGRALMWMCASRDPGLPGDSELTPIWDQLAHEGRKSILLGMPPGLPHPIDGICIPDFRAPGDQFNSSSFPADLEAKLAELFNEYPLTRKSPHAHRNELQDILSISKKHWSLAHWLLAEKEWNYFHYLDVGLNEMHERTGSADGNALLNYYIWLDEQIGELLAVLDSETVVLLASTRAAQRPEASDPDPDACLRHHQGIFILAAPNCPLAGEYSGAHVLDIAPTLLDLAGFAIPVSMQGHSLVTGIEKKPCLSSDEADQLIDDRLAGLGYI
ncbi:MAG TPA: hypothetical protein VKV39_12925 [Candidatus Sulfotelmatobacter sp.]|nr:hypothetical protein [Candidatus Sulfotelmatobacter sp.]